MTERLTPDWEPGPDDAGNLRRITKRCACGAEWQGWTWKGRSPVPMDPVVELAPGILKGTCLRCLARAEAAWQAEPPPIETEVTLDLPKRVDE
jgi:hypothetical protein